MVNVIDSRIPRQVPDEFFHLDGIATYGSAANERSVAGALDVPVGGKFVGHVDGSYIKTDDLETGGFILTPELRARAAASADPEIAALANLKGKLPNSVSGEDYSKEYQGDNDRGADALCVSRTAIAAGKRVLVIDDLVATGGTLIAACDILKAIGATIVECACMVELKALGGYAKLQARHEGVQVRIHTLSLSLYIYIYM